MGRDVFHDAKRIYASALELGPAEREAYLDRECREDESLRREVDSLFRVRDEAEGFFQPRCIARVPEEDLSGRTLSHYAITGKIGSGGMGLVYSARDTRLDRDVALKVLPPDKTADPERRRRFVQEAKAASALNHPGIVTVHDIDTSDGVTFIAMELVRGETVEQAIRNGPMPLETALRCGLEIADALAAAHAAGVVHRDIKPANIMVTESGVRILDFGLAKLLDASGDPGKTQAGSILGTAAYMSPEQADGREVDARSDVFSFGSLLYEMVTGRRAFSGQTVASTLAAILRDDPPPPSEINPEVPQELDELIRRCLSKDPAGRFQGMASLGRELHRVRDAWYAGALQPHARRTPARAVRFRFLAAALSLALVAAAVWLALGRPDRGEPARVVALTALPGIQTGAALSPDGNEVAFVWNGPSGNNFDVYVQRIGGAVPRRLTTNSAREWNPAWSPDGSQIAFLREEGEKTELIVVPSGGGPEARFLETGMSCGGVVAKMFCGIAWSPDGRQIVFVDTDPASADASIFSIEVNTRLRRRLTDPPKGSSDAGSAFSPDGRTLAFARRPSGYPVSDIWTLTLSPDGRAASEPRRITSDNTFIWGLDWSSDGREIVFSSSRAGAYGLWRVAARGGAPERLPVGADAFWPSVSRVGRKLVYTAGSADPHIWRVAAPGGPETAGPARITHSPQIDQNPALSPDGGRLAWSSMHSGVHQIWVASSDGTSPVRLTDAARPGADAPVWSPDGKQIAYRVFTPWPPRIYVVASAGNASPRRLTSGAFSEYPAGWSGDGSWVYFESDRKGGWGLWKAPQSGGVPVEIAPGGSASVESRNGTFLYYVAERALWKMPLAGGAGMRLAEGADLTIADSPDAKFVFYAGPGASLWKVSANGGRPELLLKPGHRTIWRASESGLYGLDPDGAEGPVLIYLPFANLRTERLPLTGSPAAYAEIAPAMSVSADGRWIVYTFNDRMDTHLMLMESFR